MTPAEEVLANAGLGMLALVVFAWWAHVLWVKDDRDDR